MRDPWRNSKESRRLQWFAVIVIVLFIVGCCAGCVEPFMQKYVECGVVAGQKLQKHRDEPEIVALIGKGLEKNGEKVLDKMGRCGELINEENVETKLDESGAEADAYTPWYSALGGFELAGLPIGMILLYLGRGPLRRFLHALTHNPKEGNADEVAKS